MKNATKVEKIIEPAEEAKTPGYDGVETWQELNWATNKVETFTKKVNMTDEEARNFLGGKDPKNYFKNGKIPVWKKVLGTLITDEEDPALILLKEVIPKVSSILLYKHKTDSVYTLLIPKSFSENETGAAGDYTDEYTTSDERSIVFGASNSPKSFEKAYFKSRLASIYSKLKISSENLSVYEAKA